MLRLLPRRVQFVYELMQASLSLVSMGMAGAMTELDAAKLEFELRTRHIPEDHWDWIVADVRECLTQFRRLQPKKDVLFGAEDVCDLRRWMTEVR